MTLLYIIIFPFLAFSWQERENDINPNKIDITKWKWELYSVISGNKFFSPQNKDYLRFNAYILEFTCDSTFWLNTSVNLAGGFYKIAQNGDISVSDYHEFTEVAAIDDYERELNDSLLSVFNKVSTYQVIGDTLTFEGKAGKVVFVIVYQNDDKSEEIDITKWKWELKNITSNSKMLSPQKISYFEKNAFILEFKSDSAFWFNTSVNLAGGFYKIVHNRVISISDYHEFTEVAAIDDYERELNDSLLSVFNKVTTYQVIVDTLTFEGKGCKLEVTKSYEEDSVSTINGFIKSNLSNNLLLFPVPVKNIVFIESKGQNIINNPYTIYNCSGKEIFCGKINNEQSINVSWLLPGFYLIKVGKADYLVQKFIKR